MPPITAHRPGGAAADENWAVYHHDPAGSGAATAEVALSSLKTDWTSAQLDGDLYGEPLVLDATVYVATEQDWVYALSATDGRVIWSRRLGAPVPSSSLPCGDIFPVVGITSTPVIDLARQEIFVVADELSAGHESHRLYGLDLRNGDTRLSQTVDPPGSDPAALLQRASLTIDGSNIVFGYGGNYGDCGAYHGWVVSVPADGGSPAYFEVDRLAGEREGAVWMGGAAPVVTSAGDIFVATGNGSVESSSGPYDYGDGVLELSSSLKLLQYFAPSNWFAQNAKDQDLGSMAPVVLPNGLVVEAGKSATIYLLSARRLGGIGGQLSAASGVCGADFDGGAAFSGSTVYLPCGNGVMAVLTSTASGNPRVLWQTASGAGGPPILAGSLVWSMSGGRLYALRPSDGSVEASYAVGSAATHFPTPCFGDGRIFATSADEVHAFSEK